MLSGMLEIDFCFVFIFIIDCHIVVLGKISGHQFTKVILNHSRLELLSLEYMFDKLKRKTSNSKQQWKITVCMYLLHMGQLECVHQIIWLKLHADAVCAGTSLSCLEFRHLMSGLEYSDSCNINSHKQFMMEIHKRLYYYLSGELVIMGLNICHS